MIFTFRYHQHYKTRDFFTAVTAEPSFQHLRSIRSSCSNPLLSKATLIFVFQLFLHVPIFLLCRGVHSIILNERESTSAQGHTASVSCTRWFKYMNIDSHAPSYFWIPDSASSHQLPASTPVVQFYKLYFRCISFINFL